MMPMAYTIIQRRIDIVTKVPAWAEDYIKKGDLVMREDHDTIVVNGKRYRLGESYTKFSGYDVRPMTLQMKYDLYC